MLSYIAADMLSQAEHDKNASAVLITDSRVLANETAAEPPAAARAFIQA
jgi:histidinol dehydrogenase